MRMRILCAGKEGLMRVRMSHPFLLNVTFRSEGEWPTCRVLVLWLFLLVGLCLVGFVVFLLFGLCCFSSVMPILS